jgi:hypothetical protein
MNWYEWETEADFDAWHDVINAELGYPNIETGTFQYTESRQVQGKSIAYIDDIYAEGLTSTELRPPVKSFE